ncbi:MAG TPA: potassium channel protein [Spirochaetota bacterium]
MRRKKSPLPPRLLRVLTLLPLFFGTFAFGTIALHIVDNIPYFDAFYMTVITVSTVGFMEVQPLSQGGRIIIIVMIVFSMTVVAYTIGTFLRLIIEGELSRSLGRRKMEKKIDSFQNHYIICGYGRIGRLIARELEENGIPFVVIENEPTALEQLQKDEYPYLQMDATTEEAHLAGGIMKAKGLVTAVRSDAENVFITLTARSLNPGIFILARGSDERDEQKLKMAGASKVALPYLIGGKRMAQALIRPAVVDFIDIAMMDSELDLQIEELRISKKGIATGKNLIESNIRRHYGIIIVAIMRAGKMIFNPIPQEVLISDDLLVVLGKKEDLATLKGVL